MSECATLYLEGYSTVQFGVHDSSITMEHHTRRPFQIISIYFFHTILKHFFFFQKYSLSVFSFRVTGDNVHNHINGKILSYCTSFFIQSFSLLSLHFLKKKIVSRVPSVYITCNVRGDKRASQFPNKNLNFRVWLHPCICTPQ